jgi:hypothetical protein
MPVSTQSLLFFHLESMGAWSSGMISAFVHWTSCGLAACGCVNGSFAGCILRPSRQTSMDVLFGDLLCLTGIFSTPHHWHEPVEFSLLGRDVTASGRRDTQRSQSGKSHSARESMIDQDNTGSFHSSHAHSWLPTLNCYHHEGQHLQRCSSRDMGPMRRSPICAIPGPHYVTARPATHRVASQFRVNTTVTECAEYYLPR